MTDTKKSLIKHLGSFPTWGGTTLQDRWFPEAIEKLANHLTSKGVMIFPVKPGDTVYTITGGKVKEWKVYFVGINAEGSIKFHITDEGFNNSREVWDALIGEYVFLTEEDAITELKERRADEQR